MRRRDFIALLGGAAMTWPLAVRAADVESPAHRHLGLFSIGGLLPKSGRAANNNGWPRSAITGLMQRNKSGAYRWSRAAEDDVIYAVAALMMNSSLLEYDGSKPVRSYIKAILLFSANY